MKKLSVIIPAYNEEKMIHKTASTISEILSKSGIPYELLLLMTAQRILHGRL